MHLNVLAIVAAGASMFLIGGLWYSPILFANAWMAENGFTTESLRARGGMGRVFGGSFALALLSAANLAAYLGGPETTAAWGATAGALTAVWIVAAIGITYLFEHRTLRLFAINAGYYVVAFPIMGFILGVWR